MGCPPNLDHDDDSRPVATPEELAISRVQQAITAIGRGEMVILVDDEDRENEGDLVMAADAVTAEAVNFMAKYGRGLICLTLTEERLRDLQVPMMVADNAAQFGTAFTVSVEARRGVTTGISAADRAHTIRVAVDPSSHASDLVSPGHIFPLRARNGGVLVRTGQTEGSVDLARLAGHSPAGVICEIMNDDGTMARMDDLTAFANEHSLLICSIADLIQYRMQREGLVERVVDSPFPSEYGEDFRMAVFESLPDRMQTVVVYRGDIAPERVTTVRVQHHRVATDVFMSTSAGQQGHLQWCMGEIASAEAGALLYMYPPEQTPLGTIMTQVLGQKVEGEGDAKAVNTLKPAFRDLGIGAQILSMLGVGKIRLLSHTARRIVGLEGYGLEIVETVIIGGGDTPDDHGGRNDAQGQDD
jgi:3,4-dihydroxy 2-butanone 4-phosphate synthase/GTP cyclohydrolase II